MTTATKVFTLIALSAALISSAPLFVDSAGAADICCNTTDDCPDSYGCLYDDAPCGPEKRGQCVFIAARTTE